MSARDIAAKLIEKHEGYRRHAYICPAGALTIGIGRNIDGGKGGIGISEDEALMLLNNDVCRIYEELMPVVPMAELSDGRQAVLIDMCYNLGITRFKQFKKMIAAVNDQDFEEAAKQMIDSKWASQVGYRAVHLSKLMRIGYE